LGYGGRPSLGAAGPGAATGSLRSVTDIAYAETPAGRLAYVRRGPASGAGEPLLLIMGVAGHHGVWGETFLSRLAERFDVVAFDNRGIGSSFRAEAGFTLADLAADAAGVLDQVGWDSAHVLGISMGGAIAQQLVLTHPDRVRTLTLGCTWPDPDDVWAPGVGKLAEAATVGDPLAAARLLFEANVSPTFAAEPGRFEEFTEVGGSIKVPGPVVLMQMQAAAVHDARSRLAEVAVPTLVLHGTADDVIKSSAGERLAAAIPGAQLDLWDGVGHLFFWEQPDRAAEAITQHALP
jgi:3-oxoadipate enol-lactonase